MGPHSTHQFGPFRLDAESRVLTRDGVVVSIAPRTLDLLAVLVRSNGRLLSKNELLRVVWGDVNVEEASLAFQISTLRKLLGEFGSAWIETVPKHGYRFTGPVNGSAPVQEAHQDTAQETAAAASPEPKRARPTRSRMIWAAVFACSAAAVLIGWLTLNRSGEPLVERRLNVAPLTTYPGLEEQPSLSPDGSQVAFSWRGERSKDPDIYIQLIGQGRPVPLTADPRPEFSPSWSPDGQLIAFCRQTEDGGEIVMAPVRGGAETVIARPSPVWVPECTERAQTQSWFPSSDALAVVGYPARRSSEPASNQTPNQTARAIYVVPVTGGEARPITSPAALTWGDALPSVSPDGRYLAFTRSVNQYWVSAEIQVLALNADKTAAGKPELLIPTSIPDSATVAHQYQISGLGWIPGRNEVLYARQGLWTVPVAGRRVATLVPTPGYRPGAFSVSRDGVRLAFASGSWDLDIWQIPGPASGSRQRQEPAHERALIATTNIDTNPQYSPDGKRIVFTSLRSGKLQIWVADADGSNAIQVTQSEAWNGSPRWSPDGRYIAYDAVERGKGDIYVIPAGGGPARRVTPEDSHEDVPSWSRDGRWIYFESDRTGEFELWKTEFPSGSTVKVTSNGGVAASESPDGQWIYYGKRERTGLWRKPAAGGEEELVTAHGHARFWGIYDKGACLMNPLADEVTVECFAFGSRRLSLLTRFPNGGHVRPTGPSFAVSPDGKWILYSRVEREEADLMLVDNLDVLRAR
jgi:Tol biopolymer transport system component/DNA-binding winged helix-turn-helix (wHTH) protein